MPLIYLKNIKKMTSANYQSKDNRKNQNPKGQCRSNAISQVPNKDQMYYRCIKNLNCPARIQHGNKNASNYTSRTKNSTMNSRNFAKK
jgi:hypothetical protein